MVDQFLTKPISQKLVDIIPHFLFSFVSYHTRRSYLNDLRHFCEFMKNNHKDIKFLSDIDDVSILSWKTHLEQNCMCDPASVRRKLNCLSSLFMFAKKRKFVDVNPVQLIKKPTQKNISTTNELTSDEIKKIFLNIEKKIKNMAENSHQNTHYKRLLESYDLQYAILKLLYGTGLRVSELCHLQLNDMEIQSNNTHNKNFILNIKKAKGGKEHKVYLNDNTATIILDYIKKYRNNTLATQPLFVRIQQKQNCALNAHLTPKSVYNMVVTNALEANITKKVSPHSFRAGVATLLHSKGVPLARIQKQLGHSDIATTSIYIKKSNEIEESATLKLDLERLDKNLSK